MPQAQHDDRKGRLRRRPPCCLGAKSYCKACDGQRRKAYYELHKDEWNAEREAEREAARQAELEALAMEHKKRVAAARKEHEAGVRRQKKLLRELGVPDVNPGGF